MKIERSYERTFVFSSGTRITVGYTAIYGNHYAFRVAPMSFLNSEGESGRHCIQKLRQEIVKQTLMRLEGEKNSGLYGGVKNLGVYIGAGGAGGSGGIASSAKSIHGVGVAGTVIKYGRSL